ncbi:MAG: hypothetical protein V8Q84_08665 [Bilophila sp.]
MFLRWQLMDRLEEISPFPLPDRCPLCGGALSGELRRYETECIFHGGRLLRHQCPHCDVIFGPQKMLRLSEADLAEEYRWHYTFSNESNTLEKELRAFEQLRPRKDGVYLNYGAGRWSHTGEHLRARRAGTSTTTSPTRSRRANSSSRIGIGCPAWPLTAFSLRTWWNICATPPRRCAS